MEDCDGNVEKERGVDGKNLTRCEERWMERQREGGGKQAVMRSGRGRDESLFQVVCSPEATVDPDGLRLRGNRMCINIYLLSLTFPTKTGKNSRTAGTHVAM